MIVVVTPGLVDPKNLNNRILLCGFIPSPNPYVQCSGSGLFLSGSGSVISNRIGPDPEPIKILDKLILIRKILPENYM
jgi:hypothetical protein